MNDIGVLTHEIAEWMDDPVGPNTTPPWGHTGQVSGCQNNLEVGDPLSGTETSIGGSGFNYHMQDLAFYDWFYRTPSHGTGGKFSFLGAFADVQGTCN
jgi:hypothetical protein